MVDIPSLPVSFRVEQQVAFDGGAAEVRRYRWFKHLDETIRAPDDELVLNMALGSRPAHTRVDRIETDTEPLAGDAGRLLVMMPGADYRLFAPSGAFRSLHCAIRCAKFVSVLGQDIDWPELRELSGELKPGTEIERLLNRMHDELIHERAGRAPAIEAFAQLLCVELFRHFRERQPGQPTVHSGGLSAWRMRWSWTDFMTQVPAPRLAELAQLCGLTERQLSRSFKAETGVTVGRFVDDVTMERAHRLLTTTGLSIAEIATELGFASADSFAQSYRRATGASPSAPGGDDPLQSKFGIPDNSGQIGIGQTCPLQGFQCTTA